MNYFELKLNIETKIRIIPGFIKFKKHNIQSGFKHIYIAHEIDHNCPLCIKAQNSAYGSKEYFRFKYQIVYDTILYNYNSETYETWSFAKSVQEQITKYAIKYGDPFNYDIYVTKIKENTFIKYKLIPDRKNTPFERTDYKKLKPNREMHSDKQIKEILKGIENQYKYLNQDEDD